MVVTIVRRLFELLLNRARFYPTPIFRGARNRLVNEVSSFEQGFPGLYNSRYLVWNQAYQPEQGSSNRFSSGILSSESEWVDSPLLIPVAPGQRVPPEQ